MSTIAKGMITLSALNDAYTVSLSPNSCIIAADFDGSNPRLTNAYTIVKVTRGTVATKFDMAIESISNNNIKYTVTSIDDYHKKIQLTTVPVDVLSGSLEFLVSVSNEFSTLITLQFSVVRESTMLDWIQDWETNKTKIGSTYLITPKIFVGKKITTSEDMNALTGVYIGPDSDTGAGIYGLKEGEEIFHLNESGGSIGGWDIMQGGIQTADGALKILAEGTIVAQDGEANVLWGIYKSGEATFARGNVQFHSDGSASFAGSITATGGHVGGWSINSYGLYNSHINIDARAAYIGISASTEQQTPNILNAHRIMVTTYGGVFMHYTSANSFGIAGYLPKGDEETLQQVFSMGSQNQIAGWNFDTNALWLGTKVNIAGKYAEDGITIGTLGMRGKNWYIDNDGDVSFLGGLVNFGVLGGSLVGWTLQNNRFSTDYAAIISETSHAGFYLSKYNIKNIASSSLVGTIQGNGGIYMRSDGSVVELAGYLASKKIFALTSSGESQIANWKFNDTALFIGTQKDTGFTDNSGDITMGRTGLRGHKWRLESDGSGALAGGNISWNADGDVDMSSDVTVRNLVTIPENGNAHVEIVGSMLNVFGLAGKPNIVFGVNESGNIILAYYDNEGNKLFELGPDGYSKLSVREEDWLSSTDFIKTCDATTIDGFFEIMRDLSQYEIWDIVTSRDNDTKETRYTYKAKRINSKAQAGSYATAEEAEANDGKFFEDRVAIANNTLVSGAFRYNNAVNDVQTILSLNKYDGLVPDEYTAMEDYYKNNPKAADHSIEIDWTFDTQHGDVYRLAHPVYWRNIVLFINGRSAGSFPFFWQDAKEKDA